MRAGDLVSLKMKKTSPPQKPCVALVIGTRIHQSFLEGENTATVRVMWENGAVGNVSGRLLEVINESR